MAQFDVDDTYNTRSSKHIDKEVVGKNNHAVIWIVNHFITQFDKSWSSYEIILFNTCITIRRLYVELVYKVF